MFIGEVIGTVVATRKTDNMQSLPLRLVRRLATNNAPTAGYVVAVDVVGADEGERVLIASGSSARQTHLTDARPVDAIIMAIVDHWQVDNRTIYSKSALQQDETVG
ncbi:MAG: EutN/CcmL family microcompartment protein [Chloroflexi bacterium]|nr:EutN/CcmL family microcompartment protein [Chloroflexota bacterium]